MHALQMRKPEPILSPRGSTKAIRLWDIVIMQVLAVFSVASLRGPSWLEIPHAAAGLVMVLVAPGYMLAHWIHTFGPRLTLGARWFLTFLFSLAVTIGVGLAYAYLRVRLDATTVTLGLAGVVTGEVIVTTAWTGAVHPRTMARSRLAVRTATYLLVLMLTLAGVTALIAVRSLAPKPAVYLTGLTGKLQDFPITVSKGSRANVVVHVWSPRRTPYRIAETVDGRTLWSKVVVFRHGTHWSHRFRLPTAPRLSRVRLDVTLYPLAGGTPVRTVWVQYWTGAGQAASFTP